MRDYCTKYKVPSTKYQVQCTKYLAKQNLGTNPYFVHFYCRILVLLLIHTLYLVPGTWYCLATDHLFSAPTQLPIHPGIDLLDRLWTQ